MNTLQFSSRVDFCLFSTRVEIWQILTRVEIWQFSTRVEIWQFSMLVEIWQFSTLVEILQFPKPNKGLPVSKHVGIHSHVLRVDPLLKVTLKLCNDMFHYRGHKLELVPINNFQNQAKNLFTLYSLIAV